MRRNCSTRSPLTVLATVNPQPSTAGDRTNHLMRRAGTGLSRRRELSPLVLGRVVAVHLCGSTIPEVSRALFHKCGRSFMRSFPPGEDAAWR